MKSLCVLQSRNLPKQNSKLELHGGNVEIWACKLCETWDRRFPDQSDL